MIRAMHYIPLKGHLLEDFKRDIIKPAGDSYKVEEFYKTHSNVHCIVVEFKDEITCMKVEGLIRMYEVAAKELESVA